MVQRSGSTLTLVAGSRPVGSGGNSNYDCPAQDHQDRNYIPTVVLTVGKKSYVANQRYRLNPYLSGSGLGPIAPGTSFPGGRMTAISRPADKVFAYDTSARQLGGGQMVHYAYSLTPGTYSLYTAFSGGDVTDPNNYGSLPSYMPNIGIPHSSRTGIVFMDGSIDLVPVTSPITFGGIASGTANDNSWILN